jgi:DNA-binding transcriptional ArsR family regulator
LPRPRSSAALAALTDAAPLFQALGDETRLRLVVRLCDDGPLSITSLTVRTAVTRQAVTKQLRILEGAGLVMETRRGRESIWQLQPGSLEEARRYLALISEQWDGALRRLKALVEKPEA